MKGLIKIYTVQNVNKEILHVCCDTLDFQVDEKKVARDAAHPHFPFSIFACGTQIFT